MATPPPIKETPAIRSSFGALGSKCVLKMATPVDPDKASPSALQRSKSLNVPKLPFTKFVSIREYVFTSKAEIHHTIAGRQ